MNFENEMQYTDFLTIGYLAGDGVNDINNSELNPLYVNITPLSSKFYQSNHVKLYKRRRIRVYGRTLLNILNRIGKYDAPFIGKGEAERKTIFNYFKDSLFIIQPAFRIDPVINSIDIEGKMGRVRLLRPKYGFSSEENLTPVPIFSNRNTYFNTRVDFFNALASPSLKNIIGTIQVPWPVYSKDTPDAVMWKDSNGYCYLYANINSQRMYVYKNLTSNGKPLYSEKVSYNCYKNTPKLIKSRSQDSPWLDKRYKNIAFIKLSTITGSNQLSVISSNNHIMLHNNRNKITMHKFSNEEKRATDKTTVNKNSALNNNSTSDISPGNVAKDINNVSSSSASSSSSESTKNNSISSKSSKENIASQSSNKNIDKNNATSSNTETKRNDSMSNVDKTNSNIAFIHKLMNNAIERKEYYKEEDLIDFHTAMKSPGLVVLAGLSGTGKSSLIKLYADTLNISKEQRKFIPVRPFWSDDSDLLGYVDTVHSIYQPADSGLVDTLIDAQDNPDKLYLITFDEMNLARVEYYFSQFLSVLERDEKDRYIYLYNGNLENRLYNSDKYPHKIQIKNNVLFCGTINEDESTHKFTDKVLDRSNIINLHLVNFTKNNDVIDYTKKVAKDADKVSSTINAKEFKSMKECSTLSSDQKNNIYNLLWNLHLRLHQANPNLGVGRRIVNQIITYLQNIPKIPNDDHSLDFDKAIDLQLVQRVFTKLRGSKNDIGKILKTDDNGKLTSDDGTLWQILDKSQLSDFKYSKQTLQRKRGELDSYGFTL